MQRRLVLASIVVPLVASGCVPTTHPDAGPSRSAFDPIAFFAGSTRGTGVLRIVFHHPDPIAVEGTGHRTGADTIVLDQIVRRGEQAPTRRRWQLTQTAPGRYTGSLSDAAGPVSGTLREGRLHLSFRMKGGLHADQWLVAQPGGQALRNVMVVTKLGLPVARLDETIARQ